MTLPAIDSETPVEMRPPRRTFLASAEWALVCGACAGVLWPVVLVLNYAVFRTGVSAVELRDWTPHQSLLLAAAGGGIGVLAGSVFGLDRRSARAVLQLGGAGLFCGSVGGGLIVPVALACESWLHPLLSSSLLWALVAALAGFFASCGPLRSGLAFGWALAGAVCAGGVWAVAISVLSALLDVTLPRPDRDELPEILLTRTALGAACGLLAGVAVSVGRRRGGSNAAVLVLGGTAHGILAGGLSVLAGAVTPPVHPLLSSSLAMAVAGFLAGLCGYVILHQPAKPSEPPFDEDEPAAPAVKVEWLLRESKGPWRISRPLLRVLPVLAVSAGALACAAFAPQLALVAVGLLGLAVARVLYRQEQRLDRLEERSRGA